MIQSPLRRRVYLVETSLPFLTSDRLLKPFCVLFPSQKKTFLPSTTELVKTIVAALYFFSLEFFPFSRDLLVLSSFLTTTHAAFRQRPAPLPQAFFFYRRVLPETFLHFSSSLLLLSPGEQFCRVSSRSHPDLGVPPSFFFFTGELPILAGGTFLARIDCPHSPVPSVIESSLSRLPIFPFFIERSFFSRLN